jgi:hypothetical protein
MGMVVVVVAAAPGDLSLGHEAVARLSQLGVSQASVTADDEGSVVILEGRSFDPARSLKPALAALSADGAERILRPVAQLIVSDA